MWVSTELAGHQPDHRLEMSIDLRSTRPHKPAFIAVDLLDAGGVPFMQAIPTCCPFIQDTPLAQSLRVTVDLPPSSPGGTGRRYGWVATTRRRSITLGNVPGSKSMTHPPPAALYPTSRYWV